MAESDQLTVATRRYIRENPKLVDSVFQRDALLSYARRNVQETFDGGRLIQEDIIYDGLHGGAYAKGADFNINEKQIEEGLQFNIRRFYVNITMSKEDIQVENKGRAAIFKLIDSRMQAAYMTLGAHMAISIYLNGQNAGYTNNFNGLAEALNDGSTNSWDGNTYTTYGGLTRGGKVGTTINSVPVNVAGVIEYNAMEEQYGNASYGSTEYEPNLGLTTQLGYSYIKSKFQTQQRFNDTQDPNIGFNGMKFNSATLVKSRYSPGTYISGTSDPIAVEYLTTSSNGAVTAYPTLTAETLWWLNARTPFFSFYVTNDPEFGFGFTGFKPAQGNTKVAGQVLASCAVTFQPRYHLQMYGITG
jgi:hypothetical protein